MAGIYCEADMANAANGPAHVSTLTPNGWTTPAEPPRTRLCIMSAKMETAIRAIEPYLDAGKPFSSLQIAARLEITPSGMAQCLNRMIALGYIKRIRTGVYDWDRRPTEREFPPPLWREAVPTSKPRIDPKTLARMMAGR